MLVNPKFAAQKDIGKVELCCDMSDTAATVVWSPGDGYRYTLILQTLPDPIMHLIGGSDKHVLVSYYNGSNMVSWALNKGSVHTVAYVSSHFNVTNSTACFLAAMLNMAIDGGHFDYGLGLYEHNRKQYL